MPAPARFSADDLLDVALGLFSQGGLEAVTVAAVARAAGAPSGSMYHRFAGRDEMVARLWLRTVQRFQRGYLESLGLPGARVAARAAALHVVRWTRVNRVQALLLVRHGAGDIISAGVPAHVRQVAAQQQRLLEDSFAAYRRRLEGDIEPQRLRFALIDGPYAAVRPYLLGQRPIPHAVDDIVVDVVDAVVFGSSSDRLARRPLI